MKTLLIVLLTALASLWEIPFSSGQFRASAGIVVLLAAVCILKIQNPIPLGFVAGIAVCLTRVAVSSLSGLEPTALVGSYFLEIFFYLGYTVVFYLMNRHQDPLYPMPLLITLAVSDFGGNLLEYIVRLLAGNENWSTVPLQNLLVTALVRAGIIVILVYLWNLWQKSHKKEQAHA